MNDSPTAELTYRLPGNTGSTRPGAHHSHSRGAGMNFVSHAKLMDQPDPRRLDLRASINNIQREWLVRVNQQRAAITISVIVDVSTSMHFGPADNKLAVTGDFLQALCYSAGSLGDAVALYAFDQQHRTDLAIAPRFGRRYGTLLANAIRYSQPTNHPNTTTVNVDALGHCIELAARQSALVFIVSDFHWPLHSLATLLDPLTGSLIVPLVIWDRTEVVPPAGKRLLSVQQIGATTTRHLWITPTVRKQWQDNIALRRREIAEVFASRDVKPFWITEGFNAEALSQYFMDSHA